MITASPNSPFAPTRWTLVLRARGHSPEAQSALSELCAAYYQPVFRFLQRDGRDEDNARELAQEFFARILQRGDLEAPDPERGRFRSYLLGAVKHFLVDQQKHAGRAKRGAGFSHVSLDAPGTDTTVRCEPPDPAAAIPDAWFDRQWALTVIERALATLQAEFQAAGKSSQFNQLKPWLVGDTTSLSQNQAARQLGVNEAAVKVAIHRLRKRFREAVRAEIAHTLTGDADLEAELRYLVQVLAEDSARPKP